MTKSKTLQTGSTLQQGRYTIQRVLGQGGFGITYEGIQSGLNRRVAIKEFFMSDYCDRDPLNSQVTDIGTVGTLSMIAQFRDKFVKEAQLIASMGNAPHVVRIHDIFQENGTAYYVMDFIEGGSLEQLVKKNGPLNEKRALLLATQTAEALSALHQKQTMHLDVKPANILLRKDQNGNDDVVLIDFGVSKHYDGQGRQTTTTPVGFSKGFAPIEQYRDGGVGQFSPASDVYSLGATLYYLLTATVPPEASDLLEEPIQQPKNISDLTWKVISRAMCSTRKNRYQQMSDMIADMKAATTPSQQPHTPTPPPAPQKPTPQKPTPQKPSSQNGTGNADPAATRLSNESKAKVPPTPPVKKKGKGCLKKIGITLGVILFLFLLTVGFIAFNQEYMHQSYVEIEEATYDLNRWDHTAKLTTGNKRIIGTYNIPSTVYYSGDRFTVTEIESMASDDYPMETLLIPGSVKTIGYDAFSGCENLTTVTMEEGVEVIESSVFENCKQLTWVVLPTTIKEIGYEAFRGCSLTSVVCQSSEPPYADSGAFGNPSEVTLYVPQSAISAYSNVSPWGQFGRILPLQ